jgi:hypothetical protein
VSLLRRLACLAASHARPRRPLWSIASIFLVLSASACQSLDDGARDEFAGHFTCPKERVEVRSRPDLNSYDLTWGRAQPPPDVAADPQRLALWKEKQQDSRSRGSDPVFELRGCGHSVLYHCTRANTGTHSGAVMCFDLKYPAGAKPW